MKESFPYPKQNKKKDSKKWVEETINEIKRKKTRGEILSSKEVAFLKSQELSEETKEIDSRRETPGKIQDKKVQEILEEEKGEKILKEKEEQLNEKREKYKNIYLSTIKAMGKKEMKVFRKIINESEEEIRNRVKKMLEGRLEEIEENKKEFLKFLRGKFEEKGIEISDDKAEKILEVELSKEEYDKIKIEWAKLLKKAGIKDSEIIEKITKEIETLKALEIEKWPPEKKSIFTKALDGWMKLPRWKRIALSSLVLTGIGTLFPTILPSTAILGAKYGFLGALGFRMGRGFLSSNISQFIGGAFEKFWGSLRIEKKKLESLKELAEKGINLENLEELDLKIQEILNETAKSKRKMKIAKGLVMLASGTGASMALTVAAEEVFAASIHKESVLETKPKGAVSESAPKGAKEISQKETGPTDAHIETISKEQYLGIVTVAKGWSLLSEVKKIYMEHARELGYKGDLTDKVDLGKWSEIASTRHIVGQYIIEHPEEFKNLIEKIGFPPKPDDPEYFTKLDEWLHKVPKSTFDDILHNKVPNLVYEGDKIVVTQSGDIVAFSPEGKPRLGHITVIKEEEFVVPDTLSKEEQYFEDEEFYPDFESEVHSEEEEFAVPDTLSKKELYDVRKEIPPEVIEKEVWEKLHIGSRVYDELKYEKVKDLLYPDPIGYTLVDKFESTGDRIAAQYLREKIYDVIEKIPKPEREHAENLTISQFLREYHKEIFSEEMRTGAKVPSPEETKTPYTSKEIKSETKILLGLTPETKRYLDHLIYEDDRFINAKVNELVEKISQGKITSEEFGKYYANKFGAEDVSPEMKKNLEKNFKDIIEDNGIKRHLAIIVLKNLLQSLQERK
jgi:hypothetical protein